MSYGNINVFWVRGSSNGSRHSITTTPKAAVGQLPLEASSHLVITSDKKEEVISYFI